MSVEKVKVGVIGCGQIARIGHLPWLKLNPNVELVAATDPDEKNLRLAARQFKIKNTFADARHFFDRAQPDAVVICSPHWAHAEQTLAAIDRGWHVLLEKPMATNLIDCRRIVRAAAKKDLVVQIALQKRFHWGFQKAKQMIERGDLGKIFQVTVRWYNFVPDLQKPWVRRGLATLKKLKIDLEKQYSTLLQSDPRAGGGDFLVHGPHYFDLFRYLIGEMDCISAEISKVVKSRSHEDHATALIRFSNDCVGTLIRGQNVIGRPFGYEHCHIHGTRGSLYLDVPQPFSLRAAKLYKYSMRNIVRNKYSRIVLPTTKSQCSYNRQMVCFISRILGKPESSNDFPQRWAPGPADGHAALEAVHAGYRSSQDMTKIKLPLSRNRSFDYTAGF
jgi:predicted dehydrogenase